jgi:hypothetical protein
MFSQSNTGALPFRVQSLYNPLDPKQIGILSHLYEEAAQILLDMGALFTRPYGVLADLVFGRATSYTAVLKKLKKFMI